MRQWYGVYFTFNGPEVWHMSGYTRVWTTSKAGARALVERTLRKRYSATQVTMRFAKCTPPRW